MHNRASIMLIPYLLPTVNCVLDGTGPKSQNVLMELTLLHHEPELRRIQAKRVLLRLLLMLLLLLGVVIALVSMLHVTALIIYVMTYLSCLHAMFILRL